MNINQSYGQTSFGKAYLNPKGIDKFVKHWGPGKITDELIETAKIAKKSENNDLILDENGDIYIQNEKNGKFRLDNPCSEKVGENSFTVGIRRQDDTRERLRIALPTREALTLEKNFGAGAFMPELNLKLFKAMEASVEYEKEQAKIREIKSQESINVLNELSD